jgi:hypothetical protein
VNPAVKIVTNDGAIADNTALPTAEARLAQLAEAIRHADVETKEPLLAAMRDTLPRAKKAGDFLVEARDLCKKNKILWEAWVRDNCDMSERTAQAYIRIAENWKKITKAQASAPLNIEGALRLLAQPRDPSATEENNISAEADDNGVGDSAPTPTKAVKREADTGRSSATGAAAARAASWKARLASLSPEQRREFDERAEPLVAARNQPTLEIFGIVAELVSGLAADVRDSLWNEHERGHLSKLTGHMATSLNEIKAALAE